MAAKVTASPKGLLIHQLPSRICTFSWQYVVVLRNLFPTFFLLFGQNNSKWQKEKITKDKHVTPRPAVCSFRSILSSCTKKKVADRLYAVGTTFLFRPHEVIFFQVLSMEETLFFLSFVFTQFKLYFQGLPHNALDKILSKLFFRGLNNPGRAWYEKGPSYDIEPKKELCKYLSI